MKTQFTFLIFFFACQAIFAQTTTTGISVQGIARDAEKAALVDEQLTFTFEIKDAGGASYYKESVIIKTDPYGVFSHIIGTGTVLSGSGNFNEIPFAQTRMNLVITVKDSQNNEIEVSNAPFQYTPYAKSAENGVPTGTIVAFAGTEAKIPVGWTLCDGRDLNTVSGSLNLINLIGSNAPDLRGMFLRGTGTSPVNGQPGPALRATQQDAFESHNHPDDFLIADGGAHSHTYWDRSINEGAGNGDYANGDGTGEKDPGRASSVGGTHTHTLNGGVLNRGDVETRPVNYGINYIIKL